MAFMHQRTSRLHDAAERVSETAHQMAERAEHAGQRVTQLGRHAAARSRETLTELPGSVRRHPYRTAGAVAAAAATGLALWALLRRR